MDMVHMGEKAIAWPEKHVKGFRHTIDGLSLGLSGAELESSYLWVELMQILAILLFRLDLVQFNVISVVSVNRVDEILMRLTWGWGVMVQLCWYIEYHNH